MRSGSHPSARGRRHRIRTTSLLAALGAGCCATGCGGGGAHAPAAAGLRAPPEDPSLVPGRLSADPAFHPPIASPAARAGRPLGLLRCTPAHERWTAAHVELFARRRVVLVPAGVGVAGARVRRGLASPGRCAYPLRTVDATGVVRLRRGSRLTLADLFALWGRPLSGRRMLSFRGPVRTWVDGRRRRGAPGSVRLSRGAQIVLEVGGYVPPHPRYSFPKGFL